MRIITDVEAEVPDVSLTHFNLERFHDPNSQDVLYHGYNSVHTSKCSTDGRQVQFNHWMPTEFMSAKDHFDLDSFEYYTKSGLTEVYTICPWTAHWLNEIELGNIEYKHMFYPYNAEIMPELSEKKYDVCYFGGLHSPYHLMVLAHMVDHRYRYITMDHHINQLTQQYLCHATDINLTHQEKLNRIAECRISVCVNLVFAEPYHAGHLSTYDPTNLNPAFTVAKGNVKNRCIPQFKVRMHEAAIAKTLNLVAWDPWKITEFYYEPEKEFVYYHSMTELDEIIHDARRNWEKYEPIVEAAYEKAKLYTVKNMYDMIKKGKAWKKLS